MVLWCCRSRPSIPYCKAFTTKSRHRTSLSASNSHSLIQGDISDCSSVCITCPCIKINDLPYISNPHFSQLQSQWWPNTSDPVTHITIYKKDLACKQTWRIPLYFPSPFIPPKTPLHNIRKKVQIPVSSFFQNKDKGKKYTDLQKAQYK